MHSRWFNTIRTAVLTLFNYGTSSSKHILIFLIFYFLILSHVCPKTVNVSWFVQMSSTIFGRVTFIYFEILNVSRRSVWIIWSLSCKDLIFILQWFYFFKIKFLFRSSRLLSIIIGSKIFHVTFYFSNFIFILIFISNLTCIITFCVL